MADFRRCIPVLVLLALLLGVTVVASAQAPFNCNALGVPVNDRQEGLTELVGDVLLTCTGGTSTPAGAPIPQVNITIFLSTNVTSRIINTSTNATEALLILDEAGGTAASNPPQFPCPSPTGCVGVGNGVGTGYYSATGNRNVFQGVLTGPNQITWFGVPIDAPGTNPTRTIRITNVRGNANAISAISAPGGVSIPGQITETVTSSNPSSLPIITTPTVPVAFVLKGLSFSVRNAANTAAQTTFNFLQCISQTRTQIATLRFSELFATAFKVGRLASPTVGQPIPGFVYNTESGLVSAALAPLGSTTAAVGLADFGTRVKAVFNNIPAGVTLFVDPFPLPSSSPLLAGNPSATPPVPPGACLTASETGVLSCVGPTSGQGGKAALTVSAGSATAVYEILTSDPTALENLDVGVYASYTGNPGANTPALGTSTVNGSYAPTSTVTTASASAPIPRFADTSTANNLFVVSVCATHLLFPFVTNQVGYDTGIAIANTSTDPYGTTPQRGICTTNWYGANAPAATNTTLIESGTAYTNLVSAIAPNFQGYMIADCRFQYAHGFAFITKVGGVDLAMGYLALIIPDPPRAMNPVVPGASPFIFAGLNSGEQLGY